jgi:NADP-reducing hydrogenase subunit HndB
MNAIKSLEDLKRIREEALDKRKVKEASGEIQVIVGMGTCGIAAGARETMKAVLDFIEKNNVENVVVTQTGCIGLCEQEPILQIAIGGSKKTTYGKVSPDIVEKIMASHVVNRKVFGKNEIQL